MSKPYQHAESAYAAIHIDTDKAIRAALAVPISIHCWQVDDVVGFEVKEAGLAGGGIMATGNYPGRARTATEARQDYEQVLKLVPGKLRLNIHALYAETAGKVVDRDALEPQHFANWMAWGKQHGVHLDFNPTFFAHPKANDGYTLSHTDNAVRKFWIQHAVACRRIAAAFAKQQGGPSIINHWIPDGTKDYPADRWTHRALLAESLDALLQKKLPGCVDYVESKLFGLGSEEYVVGSAEFYSSYALSRGIGYCLDMGHWHPTEEIYDKISAYLQFHKKLLLHVSRPIRWDSDHVVIFNDALRNVFLEIQRGRAWDKVAVATDYFDASINRIAAYTIGLRATRKAILSALLDPSAELQQLEAAGNNAGRLALMEDVKTLPFGAVWDEACDRAGIPRDRQWMNAVMQYERRVLAQR
ncbi:MAG: L-rhamnose isomerase [Verrucomicrobiae bacterium]|nr:L-rhamnose isomerase [Verrucomicrobiae bacterium]